MNSILEYEQSNTFYYNPINFTMNLKIFSISSKIRWEVKFILVIVLI